MKTIRIAAAQTNSTVGNFADNAEKIISLIQEASRQKADLVVFPELALSGYPVWDLANKKSFVDEGKKWLEKIVHATSKVQCAVVLGFIDQSHGQRSRNALAFISKGKLLSRYYKRLLPTYDVFLEEIFFQPGTEPGMVSWRGLRVGLTICEDIWDEPYDLKPVADLGKLGVDLIINISASPYYQGVSEKRDRLVSGHAKRSGVPILYCNQTGAQDELVFDGRSFCADATGRIIHRLPAFEEKLDVFDLPLQFSKKIAEAPPLAITGTAGEVYSALVAGIRDYCRKNRFPKVVLGLSGGIDSALVAALACDALGPSAVKGITMPSPYSSRGSWKDSEELARRLGIEFYNQPIAGSYQYFLKQYAGFKRQEGVKLAPKNSINLAMENLQSRLRGLRLMFISNDEGRLLLSTGNKSEIAMGYCTLYGDMCGGLAVIGDVYKTDVYRLVKYRNSLSEVIPKSIIQKAPSAELRPNQKDQDTLPPYEILDQVLFCYIEKNLSAAEIADHLRGKVPLAQIAEIIRKVDHNEYKRRQTPPILRVTEKAWFGRRMPITNHFQK